MVLTCCGAHTGSVFNSSYNALQTFPKLCSLTYSEVTPVFSGILYRGSSLPGINIFPLSIAVNHHKHSSITLHFHFRAQEVQNSSITQQVCLPPGSLKGYSETASSARSLSSELPLENGSSPTHVVIGYILLRGDCHTEGLSSLLKFAWKILSVPS
jgi:hypothetical protein